MSAIMMSQRPNRGHLILNVHVKDEKGISSKISFVDLAGYEKISKVGVSSMILK